MTTTIDINRDYRDTETRRPLLHRYPRQMGPQPAFIELRETGSVVVDWDGDTGNAVPVSVWHGRDRRYGIPSDLTREEIDELLEEALPLLARIHAGLEVVWDGSNHVGSLSDDAQAAEEELERLCAEQATATEWNEDEDGDISDYWPG